MTSQTSDYLAIIFIGGGSSWAREDTAFEAIAEAKREAEATWGSLYWFSDEPTEIAVFDAAGVEDWYADHRGIHAKDGTLLRHLFNVTVRLKNKGKRPKHAA